MPAIATVRAAIKAKIETVPSVGRVYGRRRLVEKDTEMKELLITSDGKLLFWFVSLARDAPYNQKRLGSSQTQATYRFQVEAFLKFNDGDNSEELFDNLVEDVIEAFEADEKLGDILIEGGPLNWEADELAFYPRDGGVLCHYARLIFPARVQTRP